MSETTTYDVRFWKTSPYKGKRGTTYRVRWRVAGRTSSEMFATRKLAESFKAKLMTAAREGIPFDLATGLPTTMTPRTHEVSWYEHAWAFMEMKWDEASPRHRQSTAEGLMTLTVALVQEGRTYVDGKALRQALRHWAFNPAARRAGGSIPDEFVEPLRWIEANSLSLATLADPQGVRRALQAIGTTLDGRPVSASTLARKRAALSGALVYAVETGQLATNPLPQVRAKRQARAESIDIRVVVNPQQATALLDAVKEESPPLHAYFACLYFAGLRPAEARNLRERDLNLPSKGWGEIVLATSYQESGRAWTDDGDRGEERQLKHRHAKETRRVPAHPELVAALRSHLAEFNTGVAGRLFVTRTGRGGHPIAPPYQNPVSMKSVYRVWSMARSRALSPQQQASPLARRPYDLRHACVSTWLSAGVAPTQVAAWAGHSVAVLLRVYAASLDGQEEVAKRRIEIALRDPSRP